MYENKALNGIHPRIDITKEFIERNNLTLNRTQEEIVNKMADSEDMFGFADGILVKYLDYENAKRWYTDEYNAKVAAKKEEEPKPITDVYETSQDLLDYLVFGWMKALDQRGLSAARTLVKLKVWLWLLGREDLVKVLDDNSLHNPYGAPALVEITSKLGIEAPKDLVEFGAIKC